MLTDALVDFSYEVAAIMKKDSLDITDGDRATIRAHSEASENSHFIVTHGTDTMPETAAALLGIENKTVVLTGALTPARFRTTDAVFNIGMAVGAVQTASPGVYIAMSGQVFEAGQVRKNAKPTDLSQRSTSTRTYKSPAARLAVSRHPKPDLYS